MCIEQSWHFTSYFFFKTVYKKSRLFCDKRPFQDFLHNPLCTDIFKSTHSQRTKLNSVLVKKNHFSKSQCFLNILCTMKLNAQIHFDINHFVSRNYDIKQAE